MTCTLRTYGAVSSTVLTGSSSPATQLAGSRQMPSAGDPTRLDDPDQVADGDLLVGLERERDPGGLVGRRDLAEQLRRLRHARPVVGAVDHAPYQRHVEGLGEVQVAAQVLGPHATGAELQPDAASAACRRSAASAASS